jgi:hypothetical protein
MHRNLSRWIVALAAAYVIGLQALLLPLSVASGAFATVFCSAYTSVGNVQAPFTNDNGCPCAAGCGMQCGGHALTGPSQTVIAFVSLDTGSLLPPPTIEPAPNLAWHSPQLARAPPSA